MTNFYFSISPDEYARNLSNEIYGCFKHIGMSWDMIMKLPIQERRAFIYKHNMEQEQIEKEHNNSNNDNSRTYEGETLNAYAKLEQGKLKRE